MSSFPDRPTQRREFLGKLATSAVVLAGTACAAPAAVGSPTQPAPAPETKTQWDDSWIGRLTAKHKAVFDAPEIADGLAPSQASRYIAGMRDALGATGTDVQAVIVIRHQAVPMFFNDILWEKYELGKETKTNDVKTKTFAVKNPFASQLVGHGYILLGCDLATRAYSSRIANQTKADSKAVYEEVKANLLPGVILQPNGIYAVHRAQEGGCTFLRST